MNVQLHLGDCLEVMRTMPDKSVDAIITDLPYGTTACSWDEIIPFEPMWEQVKRICKGVFVTTASQPFTSKLVMSNLKQFKHEWVWIKERPTNFLMGKSHPMKYTENVLAFYDDGITYNPQLQIKLEKNKRNNSPRPLSNQVYGDSVNGKYPEMCQNGGNKDWIYPKNYLTISMQRGLHPTQKPVALYEYLIRTYTNEGDTVMDITMGSGTTGVACVQTGRNFIGIEIDPTYFAIAERRIQEAQLQPRLPLEAESERFTVHSDIERQDDKWIPVSERLPDNWKPVLTIDMSESTRVPVPAFYDPETSLWSTHLPNYDLWVTHWMPLPPNPESPNDTQTQTIVYGKVCEE